jgi:alcohol dehydrogenase (cytochrome c)
MKNLRIYQLVLACTVVLGGTAPQAQELADLRNDHATPDNILTYGMGYSNQRYSTLESINTGNVSKLVPVWNYSLNNSQAQESSMTVSCT